MEGGGRGRGREWRGVGRGRGREWRGVALATPARAHTPVCGNTCAHTHMRARAQTTLHPPPPPPHPHAHAHPARGRRYDLHAAHEAVLGQHTAGVKCVAWLSSRGLVASAGWDRCAACACTVCVEGGELGGGGQSGRAAEAGCAPTAPPPPSPPQPTHTPTLRSRQHAAAVGPPSRARTEHDRALTGESAWAHGRTPPGAPLAASAIGPRPLLLPPLPLPPLPLPLLIRLPPHLNTHNPRAPPTRSCLGARLP